MGPYANTASADWIMFGVTDEMNEVERGLSARKLSKLTVVTARRRRGSHLPGSDRRPRTNEITNEMESTSAVR
jgi:hypothetical protein